MQFNKQFVSNKTERPSLAVAWWPGRILRSLVLSIMARVEGLCNVTLNFVWRRTTNNYCQHLSQAPLAVQNAYTVVSAYSVAATSGHAFRRWSLYLWYRWMKVTVMYIRVRYKRTLLYISIYNSKQSTLISCLHSANTFCQSNSLRICYFWGIEIVLHLLLKKYLLLFSAETINMHSRRL